MIRRFSDLVLLVMVCLHSPGWGFINIESLRQNSRRGFEGASSLKSNGSRGNTDTFVAEFRTLNIYKNLREEYIGVLNYRYGEASEVKNMNQGNSHFRYANRLGKSSFRVESFVQSEFNEFQKLKFRQVYGGGIRYLACQSVSSSLYMGLGGFYEDEDLQAQMDQSTVRWNLYLSAKQAITEKVSTYQILYYQPNSRLISDHRVRISFGFEQEISNSFSLVFESKWSEDTRPPEGVEKIDASSLFGANISY